MKRTTSVLSTNRIVFLRVVTIIVTLIVVGRLFEVSVLQHPQAVAEAKNEYSITQTVQAKRGTIYLRDLNGGSDYPVALNIDSFTVIADPFLIANAQDTADSLAKALGTQANQLVSKLTDKHKRFVVIQKKLDKPTADKVTQANLKGISVQTVPSRYYPESTLASQVIGFVDANGDGKNGIEGFFNEDLKGYDGSVTGQKDAKRRIISEDDTAQPKDGTNFVLTIDHNLQFIVEQKLKQAIKDYAADSGSVVVMDVKTGAVLAMANEPDFDLNNYNTVPTDQQHVFVNSAVSESWEPGSIFKGFTLSAGMDLGLFDPNSILDLNCSLGVNGFQIHNAEDKCYAHPSLTDVLSQSINLGTAAVADKVGNDNFARYISAFGFGSRTGIELEPESAGRFPDVKQWQDVNRATISFGQGITTTPLQMVTAYAAIANGGKLMRPYIVAKRIEANGQELDTKPQEVRQVLKPQTVSQITGMLHDVVTNGLGKRAGVPGYEVAGKTGTAQVVGADGKYDPNAHIGSFAGFFPSNDPQFAMIVKLDKPKNVNFAESSAAPTFGEIAAWLLHYAKVPPTSPTS